EPITRAPAQSPRAPRHLSTMVARSDLTIGDLPRRTYTLRSGPLECAGRRARASFAADSRARRANARTVMRSADAAPRSARHARRYARGIEGAGRVYGTLSPSNRSDRRGCTPDARGATRGVVRTRPSRECFLADRLPGGESLELERSAPPARRVWADNR